MFRLLFLFLLFPAAGLLAQPAIDVQKYRFEIGLSDQSDALTGKAVITVLFAEPSSVLQLNLVSIQEDKGMQAFLAREGAQVLPLRHVANQVFVTLTRPATKGEIRTFELQYMGTPIDGLIIARNKHGERTFFSDNWPDRARHWIPCHDTPADKAAVEFVVTAPDQYSVVSNGIRINETRQGNRKITHWREDQPLATKVMAIGVARFAVKTYADSPPGIPVSAWVYPQDSTHGFYDYALAPGILQFFTGYIAPYPYRKLANVQSKTIFGGMENANAIFYSENSVTGDRKSEDLLAHEIAHQWFGNTATEKSYPHLWLSEGFATYLTNIYLEKKYGADTLRKRMAADREQIIQFARTSALPVVDSTTAAMDLLNANSYQKGSWILHMLRHQVGDTLFQKIIRTYYGQFKDGNADSRDFQAVAEQVSGQELNTFFGHWLYQPGVPELKVEVVKGDPLQVKITQTKIIYEFPLQLALEREDGSRMDTLVFIREREQTFQWKGWPAGVKVHLDPHVRALFREVR